MIGQVGLIRMRQLYDLLVESPLGVTAAEACAEFGWKRWQFDTVLHNLRHRQGGMPGAPTEPFNVICDMGQNGSWRYRLVGTADDEGLQIWAMSKVNYAQTMMGTGAAMMRSVMVDPVLFDSLPEDKKLIAEMFATVFERTNQDVKRFIRQAKQITAAAQAPAPKKAKKSTKKLRIATR